MGSGLCEYELDEDWRVARAATEFRVRVSEAEAGPWSEWVTVEVVGNRALCPM